MVEKSVPLWEECGDAIAPPTFLPPCIFGSTVAPPNIVVACPFETASGSTMKPSLRFAPQPAGNRPTNKSSMPPPPAPKARSLDPVLVRIAQLQSGMERASKDSPATLEAPGGGEGDDALHWASRRLEERRKQLGDDHPDVAQLHVELGDILERKEMHKEALPHFREALSNLQAANGERHPSLAPVYKRMAEVFKQQGRQYDALKHYKEELRILRRAGGQDNCEVAETITDIGVSYTNQGRLREGCAELEEALNIYRKLTAKAHRSENNHDSGLLVHRTLTVGFGGCATIGTQERKLLEGQVRVLSHLSIALCRLGEQLDGVGRQEEAMDIQTKLFGRDSDEVATSLLIIARIHADVGMLREALEGYETALEVLKRFHRGPRHKRIALVLNNIGVIYSKQGTKDRNRELYDMAMRVHEEALDIYRCADGFESEDVADTLYNMAVCRDHMGDKMVALDNAEEAVRIYIARRATHSVGRAANATMLADRLHATIAKETLASASPVAGSK